MMNNRNGPMKFICTYLSIDWDLIFSFSYSRKNHKSIERLSIDENTYVGHDRLEKTKLRRISTSRIVVDAMVYNE